MTTNDRQAWLQERRRGIGGSDVAAILGLSRFKGPFDVWQSKVSDPTETDKTKPWTERGKYLEPAVAAWYADDAGVKLSLGSTQIMTGPESWMTATVDAVVDADPPYGLECKTTRNHEEWGEQGSDVVPVEYQIQCAWYMMVMDVPRWDVAVLLTLKEEFRRYTLVRDPEVEKHIVSTCRVWWQKHVVEGVQPQIDGSTGASEWLRRRFPRAIEPLRGASDDEIRVATQLHQIKKSLRDLERQERDLKNQLIHGIGSAEGFEWLDGAVTYKEQTRKTLDAKALEELHPDLVAKFQKTSSFRVLRIKHNSSDEE